MLLLLLIFACVLIGAQASEFYERESGVCTDDGGSYIGTKEDCEEAAGVLGLSDTTANIVSLDRKSVV